MVYVIWVGPPSDTINVYVPDGILALGLPNHRTLPSTDVAYGLSYYPIENLRFVVLTLEGPASDPPWRLQGRVIGPAPEGTPASADAELVFKTVEDNGNPDCACTTPGPKLTYPKTTIIEE